MQLRAEPARSSIFRAGGLCQPEESIAGQEDADQENDAQGGAVFAPQNSDFDLVACRGLGKLDMQGSADSLQGIELFMAMEIFPNPESTAAFGWAVKWRKPSACDRPTLASQIALR